MRNHLKAQPMGKYKAYCKLSIVLIRYKEISSKWFILSNLISKVANDFPDILVAVQFHVCYEFQSKAKTSTVVTNYPFQEMLIQTYIYLSSHFSITFFFLPKAKPLA